ncbi:MAG TPA: ABC transporter permease subunit [Gemmataceae bacterium]|jgi:ABC-type transport system involved in multi-copper enzyme maturation permease subunit|nr:ABC transporter permease subunit [Gemmataceae bacterium]
MSLATEPHSPIETRNSAFRAFVFLVGFAIRRQARVRQMVGIAIGLLLICLLLVATFSASGGWDRYQWRLDRQKPYAQAQMNGALVYAAIDQSEYMDRFRQDTRPLSVFSRWVVFLLFLGFLLPLFSLSFATGALGQEREGRSLVWLMTRPLPRSGVYLAKFLGMLPWCLALTVGGFGLLCLAGGETGRRAFVLYGPGVFAGSLAFAALFHLFGALLPRPSIIALLYAFFFETLLSELPIPGTLKRLSINYYTRCLLYAAAEGEDVPIESSSLFVPVSPRTAWIVLTAITTGLTALGMWLFAKMEHRDDV